MRKQASDRNTESTGANKAINRAIQLVSLYRREGMKEGGGGGGRQRETERA